MILATFLGVSKVGHHIVIVQVTISVHYCQVRVPLFNNDLCSSPDRAQFLNFCTGNGAFRFQFLLWRNFFCHFLLPNMKVKIHEILFLLARPCDHPLTTPHPNHSPPTPWTSPETELYSPHTLVQSRCVQSLYLNYNLTRVSFKQRSLS